MKTNPLNTWTGILAVLLTVGFYIAVTANGSGALSQKVSALEANQQRLEATIGRQDAKLDSQSEGISSLKQSTTRIETKLDDLRQILQRAH